MERIFKEYQINDSEINKVNNSVLELDKRFKKEKVNLDKLIFNNKSIKFQKRQLLIIEKGFLGNLDFKTIAIDINKFQKVEFKDILNNLHGSYYQFLDFDFFEKDKIAVAYPNSSYHVSIAIIHKNRKILKSTQTSLRLNSPSSGSPFTFDHCSIKLKTNKNILVIYLLNNILNKTNSLSLMNSNLEMIKSTSVSYPVVSLDINETNIYYLTNQSGYKIMIFDHHLSNVRNIGQNTAPQQPFYFSNDFNYLIQTINKNSKFYCLNSTKLDIIDEISGSLLKSISIQGNKMAINSQNNLLVLAVSSSKIYKYNLDGVLLDEIKLENVPQGLDLKIVDGDYIEFLSKPSMCFYVK